MHFIQQNHFAPILNIVYSTMPRDNLLNSACLELFEFIRHVNVKPLVEHLVVMHRARFKEITYVDTFQNLILRYENTNQPPPPDGDMTLFSNDGGTPDDRRGIVNGNRWQSMKEMDAAEQAYFDTSDDDEEDPDSPRTKRVKSSGAPLTNGLAPSPMLKSLVDYPDDDDDALESLPSQSLPTNSQPKLSPSPMLQTPPPERLSEKRRRADDDDEDELGKLSTTTKRRNSGSSISSAGSDHSPNNTNALRRKKGFIAFKDKESPSNETHHGDSKKKIAISLSGSGVKTPPAQSDMEVKEGDGG